MGQNFPGLFWADSEERYNEARHKKCKSGLAPVWHCHSTRSSEVIFISQIEPGYQISSELGAVILCELVASVARPVVLERRISRVDTMYGSKHLSNPLASPSSMLLSLQDAHQQRTGVLDDPSTLERGVAGGGARCESEDLNIPKSQNQKI